MVAMGRTPFLRISGIGWYSARMVAHGLTPILNVSNIEESFAWFEKL
jgi:hypothetical protein